MPSGYSFTPRQVRQIISMKEDEGHTFRFIASYFGVHWETVSDAYKKAKKLNKKENEHD